MTTQRMPGPFWVSGRNIHAGPPDALGNRTIATVRSVDGLGEDVLAEMIAQALNAHDELLAACKAVANNWDTPTNSKGGCIYCGGKPCDCFLGIVRAALANAREEVSA